jgi:hypothetical protein
VTDVENSLTDQIDAIDKAKNTQLESIGLVEKTKAETLAGEVTALRQQLKETTDLEEQAQLRETLNTKQNELQRERIVESAENKKTEAKKQALKKQSALEESAFNAKKATDIANIWISTAIGIAGAWATSIAQMGPVAGSIAAGVMTALLLSVAGVQTGAVSSQSYKKPQGLQSVRNQPAAV